MATAQGVGTVSILTGRGWVDLGSPISDVRVDSAGRDAHGNFTISVSCMPNPQFWERLAVVENAFRQKLTEEEIRKRDEAGERAQELLCQHLTPQQCEDRGEFGVFWIDVADHRFRIGGWSGTIDEYDEKGKLASYCLQTERHGLPKEDRLLAILLMLRHVPEEFYARANVLWHREAQLVSETDNFYIPNDPPYPVPYVPPAGSPWGWHRFDPSVLTPNSTYREWFDRHFYQ